SGCTILAAGCAEITTPALDGTLKSIITPSQYPRALSAAESREATLSIAGTPATGAFYGLLPALPFLLRSFCQVGFIAALFGIKVPPKQGVADPGRAEGGLARQQKLKTRAVLARAVRGYGASFRFLYADRALFRVLICAPLVNLMVFSAMIWTVFYLRENGYEPLIIGLVSAGFALGSIVGSVFTPLLSRKIPPGYLAICGLAAMLTCFALLFALPHEPALMGTLAFFAMLPSPPLNAGLFTYVFAATSENMQGRVMATFSLIANVATVFAPVLVGMLLGANPLLLGAIVCGTGLLGVILLLFCKEVRELPLHKT
ncbi:MAG: MFS transporter, partial [Microbacteriaceae bacterium]|nr:MFS transporter [Microbacteriaceae bacterium]